MHSYVMILGFVQKMGGCVEQTSRGCMSLSVYTNPNKQGVKSGTHMTHISAPQRCMASLIVAILGNPID